MGKVDKINITTISVALTLNSKEIYLKLHFIFHKIFHENYKKKKIF